MTVYLDGARVELAPSMLIGQGGEAEVYDLGDGRVLKWWKPADHADYAGDPIAQQHAARRLAEAAARLRAIPAQLPSAVVVPTSLAVAGRRGADRDRVVGYAMPRVAGTAMLELGEIRWRRANPHAGARVRDILLALHAAIAGLHRAGVVIGDCNDLNILVEPDPRAVHLIDVDSYQLPGFPCAMFSERFLDPRLCDGPRLVPSRPHDEASDWFAFAVMVLRTLLGVGPWGGVHPALGAASARALARASVLAPGITYPRAAAPIATLPDDLVALLRAIFEDDRRGVFPRAALADLRYATCASCGREHARRTCPHCRAVVPIAPAPIAVAGALRWESIAPARVQLGTRAVGRAGDDPDAPVYLAQGALWRRGRLGDERIGGVLANQTHAWVGPHLGAGLYRAGGLAVGFVFRPERGPLDDRVALPPIRGHLADAHATLADERAWLWLTAVERGRLITSALVIDARGAVLAHAPDLDAPWLAGLGGACAVGPHLFVPTDAGIVRIEVVGGALVHTRTFADTAALVGAGDRLALHPTGLDVLRADGAIRLYLS